MRRDLPLGVDPTALVSGAPDRSQLKEMFRRFEFRRPAQPRRRRSTRHSRRRSVRELEGQGVGWHEAPLVATHGRLGVAIEDGRIAVASDDGVLVADWNPAEATPRARRRNSSPTTRRRCTCRFPPSTTR